MTLTERSDHTLVARIHVNIHEVRQSKPAISIRVYDPTADAEVAVYRCSTLGWYGPTTMVQDDQNRLGNGARVWVEVMLADIESVDGELPPWL